MIYQHLTQKQQVRILPQQIQLLNLFHLNTLELEHRIQQELEENPLLDETPADEPDSKEEAEAVQDFADWEEFGYDDIPDYKTEYANYFSGETIPDKPLAQVNDFRQQLKEQCRLLLMDEKEYTRACYLIDSLSENGMLDQSLSSLAEDMSFKFGSWIESTELERLLAVIQGLDPAGVGARDIRECLLLQLTRKNTNRPDVAAAIRLVQDHFTDLKNRQLDKIMAGIGLEEDELRIVLELIAAMPMQPVASVTEENGNLNYIVPDFIVAVESDVIEVSLARQRSSSLHISNTWMESVKSQCNKEDKATGQYLKSKLQAAEWFISAIQQRESTMLRVMRTIVKWQYEYFKEGDPLLLRPMILKNIAQEVGVDISTVSRITSNKYAATPFGNILLKDLFSEGLANEQGEVVSNRIIQHALEEAIKAEDKKTPFTDHQLAVILAGNGYKIARRTVAKYRELLRIPTAQLRAMWG
ncbi:RNA polymerase factor sigma-54 [Pseudoflavitalea sp. G-6-1-2]|uniref:RNA polymerase factor sigma-54 n=1 Tax=Pseudoflavitalea sp. G-6-1-2 TaxID=2728841 RepID=UPI00146D43DB|nr:RNA polymerase factor sigma-54 [Pseudoflavitalea sp. G-6-1-2]NML22478.1 RNA polymerase factor sigma-54 [Pseudoflavitalea sp. G-6-1-2]